MKLISIALCSAAALTLAACSTGSKMAGDAAKMGAEMAAAFVPAEGSALAAIYGDAELSSLAGAIRAAGLESALAGSGPFTIIAPSNAAFAEAGDVPADALAGILQNHVIAADLDAATILGGIPAGGNASFNALSGEGVMARTVGDDLFFRLGSGGAAKVLRGDVQADNGVIHVVDRVLGTGPADDMRDMEKMMEKPMEEAAPNPLQAAYDACYGGNGSVIQYPDADGGYNDFCQQEDGSATLISK